MITRKKIARHRARELGCALACLLALGLPGGLARADSAELPDQSQAAAQTTAAKNPDKSGLVNAAERFFGDVSHGVAEAIEKAVAEHGVPTGYIAGEEISAGLIGGLRYGAGTLLFSNDKGEQVQKRIYWQGPSIGLDAGANASKVFILVYNLRAVDDVFGRHPIAQAGVYLGAGGDLGVEHRKTVTLVPVHSGVGVRAGARIGYVKISPKRQWFPL